MLPCVAQNQINSNSQVVTLLSTHAKLNYIYLFFSPSGFFSEWSKLNNFIKLTSCRVHILLTVFSLCITFVPYNAGAFDLLIYTDKDLEVPEQWEESGPQLIDQSEEVRLRSFTTTIHKVKSMVAYKRTNSTWFLFFYIVFWSIFFFLCFVFNFPALCIYLYKAHFLFVVILKNVFPNTKNTFLVSKIVLLICFFDILQ